MTRYTYLLIIWTLAACCAISRADDSKYVPMCFSTTRPPPKRNALYLFAGPPAGNVSLPNRGIVGVGYFRQLKDDLELGVIGIGTDRAFIGWAFGVGARF